MIRLALVCAAMLVAVPASAQTVDQVQTAISMEVADLPGVTVKQWVDTMKKSGLLVRTLTGSKAIKPCQTEFKTPEAKIQANMKGGPSFKVDWSAIGEIRRDGDFALELVQKAPDDVRTVIEFPDSQAAYDFAEAFEFLRRNCR